MVWRCSFLLVTLFLLFLLLTTMCRAKVKHAGVDHEMAKAILSCFVFYSTIQTHQLASWDGVFNR
jgi:hypothetical protein